MMMANAMVSASTPTSRGRDKRQTLRYTLCNQSTQAAVSLPSVPLMLCARQLEGG